MSFTHEDYGKATSFKTIASKMPWASNDYMPDEDVSLSQPPARPSTGGVRANATLLMLARNSDTDGAIRSVRELEDRFNHQFHYPWVFLNEEPFSDDFKA